MKVELTHPAYNQEAKLRMWTRKVSALRVSCIVTAAKLVRRFAPDWTQQDHACIAAYHDRRAKKLDGVWGNVAERAALKTFGRPWQFTDYKVCAIAREEFTPAQKRVLRHCAYNAPKHAHLALVHAKLAKTRLSRCVESVHG